MWLLANNHSPVPWGHAPALENMTPEEAGVFLREMMVGLDRTRPSLPKRSGLSVKGRGLSLRSDR